MNLKTIIFQIIVLSLILSWACTPKKIHVIVSTPAELIEALSVAQPGDTVLLTAGQWQDVDLVIEGRGLETKPIVVMAETPGATELIGNSSLKLAGEHLVISGLYFHSGYTLTSEVISFKKNKKALANNCRVTNCVIENYSNPERHESDYWVGMYGKNNRFDHNALVGKGNKGVTMAVRLNNEASQENNHLIDYNYFGPRGSLGSNGGESLRIGTSHYSLTNSYTQVLSNYFDRCNGEVEIVSNKSCGNTFKNNVFFESQGTFTFRHGNENLFSSNAFLGNKVPFTGGIRVINRSQTITNNYLSGITGYRFRGALTVMNGVPNSPINRYHSVENSEINNNTLINCDFVQLCAGSDAERSAVPQTTSISRNVFWNEAKDDVFTVYDDISGITFEQNILSPNIKVIAAGFKSVDSEISKNEKGLYALSNQGGSDAGITNEFSVVTKEETGPAWYVKPEKGAAFDFGKKIKVSPGTDLFEVIENSNAGDVLALEPGDYIVTKVITLDQPVSIVSDGNARIKFEKSNLFSIENGGALKLKGLIIDGGEAPDYAGNAVIRTSRYSMNKNYQLWIEDCQFEDLDVNHSFHVLDVYKNTFADSILIKNSKFSNVSGSILALDKEIEDRGIYNAEFVTIQNSSFNNIGQPILKLHRGGSDESTFGPVLRIENSQFNNIGFGPKNSGNKAMVLHGVQNVKIESSTFANTKELNIYHTVGEPVTVIESCVIDKKTQLRISDNTAIITNLKITK